MATNEITVSYTTVDAYGLNKKSKWLPGQIELLRKSITYMYIYSIVLRK